MNQTVSRSMLSRLLSVATVLTLVGFAASVDLQPAPALASPGVSVDRGDGVSYLEDNDNGNHNGNHDGNNNRNHDGNDDGNNDENRDENRNNDDNDHNGNNRNNGNNGGEGLFSLICSVPGFATNVGCATGLLGN
jgi:hypothetical protein